MPTFMIEGNWSGPHNPAGEWTRMQHREYTTCPTFAEKCQALGQIAYGDGTLLYLRVQRWTKKDGKRLPEIKKYTELIHVCVATGINRVDDLPKPSKEFI